jgi:LysM repeat protein
MKTIGIKLADGSFYPVLEDNKPSEKKLELTTAHNNQTKVMVDLYRSATCSMDDAEYVDSLQIENLNARPNGEADISFSVSLDEDNQLSAKIVDSETGNESNTEITLVSRTLEERLVTDEYGINDSKDDKSDKSGAAAVAAGALAAGGLLAAAAAMRDKQDPDSENEIEVEEEPVVDDTIDEEVPFGDETFVDEPIVEDEVTEEAGDDFAESGDLSDGAENIESSEADAMDEITESDALPDMDFDIPEESTEGEEIAASDEINEDDLFTSEETVTSDETIASDETFSSDETISAEDSIEDDTSSDTLPDMDFDLPDDTTETSEIENPEMPDDFFNTDDLDNTDNNEDIMNDSSFDSDSPAAGGLSFDGLYDEETERGTPAQTEADEVKKKTKVPVIICIICAIICIIATLLILFIIPSKYNLITKKHAKDKGTTVAIEQPAPEPEPAPAPEPEPAVPEAKEDEIVIIEKAEEVVPKQPPVAEEKPKNITYKIKWGDTLWDIADTYYKNPWRYKYIARYNGIKNPDYIISGTKIIIPAE